VPARSADPSALTSSPRKGQIKRLVHSIDRQDFQTFGCPAAARLGGIRPRHDYPGKSQLRYFAQALLATWRGTDLAGKPNLSKDCQSTFTVRSKRPVPQARHDRKQHRKIRCRLDNSDATNGIYKNVLIKCDQSCMTMCDRQEHRESICFKTDTQAPRIGRMGRIDQGLNLNKQRPGAFLGHQHATARNPTIVLGKEHG
jgi:hypothetical protein